MARGYQLDFSKQHPDMFEVQGRERKARTMLAVLQEFRGTSLSGDAVLNVGGSAGIIDNYLSEYVGRVVGLDIDAIAVKHAHDTYRKENLHALVADALRLPFASESFDVVICSHVYEHVPDARKMMAEIDRVLKVGGVCYFAAGNRLAVHEPHYQLPFLSILPRPLAHLYLRALGKGTHYYEKHLTYWGLKSLAGRFRCHDYTAKIIADPRRYQADYMLRPGSRKQAVATLVSSHLNWLTPGYIWLLEKVPG